MQNEQLLNLIPESLKKTYVFFGVVCIPQLFLFVSLLRGWFLMHGEMSAENIAAYKIIWMLQFAVVLSAGIVSLILLLLKKLFNSWLGLFFCVLQLVLTLAMCYQLHNIEVFGVPVWMFNNSAVILALFASQVPGLFYCLMNVAGIRFPFKISAVKDFILNLLALIALPLCYYLFVVWFSKFQFDRVRWGDDVLLYLFIAATAVVFVSFFRCMLHLYNFFGNKFLVRVLACLVFPIAGLLLNIVIPFPADLQDWTVYFLTILNAVAVLLPERGSTDLKNVLIYCARTAMFSFTLYFFILFLPFLPLAIPAMMGACAGFLILAPTFLFFIHGRLILDQGRELAHELGRFLTVLLTVCMFCLLPTLYSARALYHKDILLKAVDIVYRPDFSQSAPKVNTYALRKVLKRLKQMNEGIYVPILSDCYNKVVFNNMVLPEHKINMISKVLLGEEIDVSYNHTVQFYDLFGASSGARARIRNAKFRPPDDVKLLNVSSVTTSEGNIKKTDITLTMHNDNYSISEFECSFDIPDGVFVCDYWLDVNGTNVNGMLFDKKAAEWVYGMIRDTTTKDPGLLLYKNRNTLQLNVYPFNNNQTRTCGFSLVYPAAMTIKATSISNTPVIAEMDNIGNSQYVEVSSDSYQLFIPKYIALSMPKQIRIPYYHILVDASKESGKDQVINKLTKLRDSLDGEKVKVTLVNYGSFDVSDGSFMDIDEACDSVGFLMDNDRIFKGGFNLGRALKSAILEYQKTGDYGTVPVYIIVNNNEPIIIGDMDEYQKLKPDSPLYLNWHRFKKVQPQPVHIFKDGGSYDIVPVNQSVYLTVSSTNVFCRATGGWQHIRGSLMPEGKLQNVYAGGVKLWNRYSDSTLERGLSNDERASLLAEARRLGILYPGAAYVVMENTTQIEFLKQAEKQALTSNEALEFDADAPEWLLVVLLGSFFLLRKKKSLCKLSIK